jgi:hypothetical protein
MCIIYQKVQEGTIFPPVISYAEVHYKPRFVPSVIFMKRPEILFDAPARIEPGRTLPVFLFIKDADRYPVVLEDVVIHLIYENGEGRFLHFPYYRHRVDTPIWWDSFNIVPEFTGQVIINCLIRLRSGKKISVIPMNNYRQSGKMPLTVSVSDTNLPKSEGWYHGDIHCHSYYTSDQVEFGAPLEAMALAGYCAGLDWISATDHSYDLDDYENDYLSEDPSHSKWDKMKKKTLIINDSLQSFTVIPGEEITCRTQKGRNCHLLSLNSDAFIKGSGDSGERGLSLTTERSIGEAVAECLEWGGFACAAHPLEHIPFLERLLLGRGAWTYQDMQVPGLSALQIHNGTRDRGFDRGLQVWKKLILKGKRISIVGGSDAHGDFNYRRRVSIPFLSLSESGGSSFGSVRTLVKARSRSVKDIVDALRNGNSQISEGPYIDLTVSAGGRAAHPGETINQGKFTVRVLLKSSPEFGFIKKAQILYGKKGDREEKVLAGLDMFHRSEYQYVFESAFELDNLFYFRCECETEKNKICLANPVWVDS